MRTARKVRFLYRFANAPVGSTQMRVFQTVRALRQIDSDWSVMAWPLADKANPRIQACSARLTPRADVFVLSKTCLKGLTQESLDILRNRCAAIIADPVDRDYSTLADLTGIDMMVACSASGLGSMREMRAQGLLSAESTLIEHAYDIRLAQLPVPAYRSKRALYVGDPRYLHGRAVGACDLDVVPVRNKSDMKRAIPRIAAYPLHVAFRPPSKVKGPLRVHKPFTKGFTAAACAAPVLVNPDVDDATQLLGTDYPFFADPQSGEEVADAVSAALQSIGTPVWQDALDRMKALEAMSRPTIVARKWIAAFDSLCPGR